LLWTTPLLQIYNQQLWTNFNPSTRYPGSQRGFSWARQVRLSILLFLIAGFVLPFGQFAMIFPSKWFYISMVVLFEIGSAICGAAPNINALIVGRVIAGIGAVGIYTGALFLISVNTSEEERYLQSNIPLIKDRNI
jgi:MFS family permease